VYDKVTVTESGPTLLLEQRSSPHCRRSQAVGRFKTAPSFAATLFQGEQREVHENDLVREATHETLGRGGALPSEKATGKDGYNGRASRRALGDEALSLQSLKMPRQCPSMLHCVYDVYDTDCLQMRCDPRKSVEIYEHPMNQSVQYQQGFKASNPR
jgi:hypothetical protein